MEYDYNNKVALITGSSRGIGFATALELGQLGFKVAICSKNKKNLDKAINILDKKKN